MLKLEPCNCPHTLSERRGWAPFLALALTLALLVFRAALSYINTPPLAGSFSNKNFDPFSLEFPGNETVGTVHLSPCEDGVDCGYIVVPKDYFNASTGVAQIAVTRRRATASPFKGHVMMNPGGPGGDGTVLALGENGKHYSALLGPQWNILGFAPRGIGRTRPSVHCFPDAASQRMFFANTMFENAYEIPKIGNLSDPANFAALVAQQRKFLALKEAQARACGENMDVEELKYMGTATVVRDMDFMTKVLDGVGAKINYKGGSYGSILGAYLVNMLPERVGYVTVDAIADAAIWATEPSHTWATGWTVDAEQTYRWFTRDCSKAGPPSCALASHASEDPAKIEARVEAFIARLFERPLPASGDGSPGYITSGAARAVLFLSLEFPPLQPVVAHAFAEAMAPLANGTRLLRFIRHAAGRPDPGDLTRFAVTCADSPAPVPAPSAGELAGEQMRALARSRFGTSVVYTDPDGGCEFWPTRGRAAERFVGPWNASLAYPMLILSSRADPITPLGSALRLNHHMPNSSTLVIQDSPGHGAYAMLSVCTARAHRAYWAGQPPANGTVCPLSVSAFPSTGDARSEALSADDRKLLNAARGISDAMREIRVPGLSRLL